MAAGSDPSIHSADAGSPASEGFQREIRRQRQELAELQLQLQAILQSTPHGLCMLSPVWTVVWANDAMAGLFDPPLADAKALVGWPLRRLFDSAEEFDAYVADALAAIRRGGSGRAEFRFDRPSGVGPRWLDISTVRLDPAKTLSGFVVSITDTTERRRAAETLALSERFLKATLDSLSEQIAILDESGTLLSVNDSWRIAADRAPFLGSECRIGESYLEACRAEAYVHEPHTGASIAAAVQDVLQGGTAEFAAEFMLRKARRRWFSLRARRVALAAGVHVALTQSDITERKLAEEQLRHYATHDPLTGLANRTLLYSALTNAASSSQPSQDRLFGLLFIDLDGFKNVNDTHGHLCGDLILVAVAERILHCLRQADTAARIGGDEIAVLLKDVQDAAEAAEIAERIESALSEPFDFDGASVAISASVGIALGRPGLPTPEDLLREADRNMYQRKPRKCDHPPIGRRTDSF